MPKVEVNLTDKEFEILKSLEKIEGRDGEKLVVSNLRLKFSSD